MMGKALNSAEVPVMKGTSGILVIPEAESGRVPVMNCIRCGKCVSVCPMGLEPYLLERMVGLAEFEMAENNKILDCMECGSCHYICPSGRPLLDYLRLGKNKVGILVRTRVKN
jgi:electron transport complex protein RnfC